MPASRPTRALDIVIAISLVVAAMSMIGSNKDLPDSIYGGYEHLSLSCSWGCSQLRQSRVMIVRPSATQWWK
jgi:hypothetical protein